MSVEITTKDQTALIKITDSSLVGPTVDKLKEDALVLIQRGVTKITLDLSSTNYIDSSGIGKILFINKKLLSIGGVLSINGITPTLLDFFETLSIDRIIPIEKK